MRSGTRARKGPFVTRALVIIPARRASTRLPDKPLADIAGRPMIAHVVDQGMAADIGPVVVACDDPLIRDAVIAAGGRAVLTDPNLPSGSDRVEAAAREIDPDGAFEVVLNLQGDVPLIDPAAIRAAFAPLEDPAVDIGTIATEIVTEEGRTDPGHGQDNRHAGRRQPFAGPLLHPGDRAAPGPARFISTSGSMPTGARRLPASSHFRLPLSKPGKTSSN